MRIPDFQFSRVGGIFLRHEAIQETLDDFKGLLGFDIFGSLLLDEAVEGLHDMLGIIRVEEAIPIVDRDVVLARKAVDLTIPAPRLGLFEFE